MLTDDMKRLMDKAFAAMIAEEGGLEKIKEVTPLGLVQITVFAGFERGRVEEAAEFWSNASEAAEYIQKQVEAEELRRSTQNN